MSPYISLSWGTAIATHQNTHAISCLFSVRAPGGWTNWLDGVCDAVLHAALASTYM